MEKPCLRADCPDKMMRIIFTANYVLNWLLDEYWSDRSHKVCISYCKMNSDHMSGAIPFLLLMT